MEDRVADAVSQYLLGRSQRRSPTGFINICCPCCIMRGETPDRKHRCGIKHTPGGVGVHCFNCGLTCGFTLGHSLGRDMKMFLGALGMATRDVNWLALWAEKIRREIAESPIQQAISGQSVLSFPAMALPPGARSVGEWDALDCDDPDYLATVRYLLTRGDVVAQATTYYWTPERYHDLHRRLIIPCCHDGRIVGWVARSITDVVQPRYHKQLPSNYLFNTQFLNGQRKFVFLVEGVFDALVIDGVAALGASLNERQIAWIAASDVQPIVVPDRDFAGNRLIDIAITQNWPVAFPHYGRHQWWEADLKDVDDAVRRYGKLYVMQSLLATAEIDPSKIQQRAKYRL